MDRSLTLRPGLGSVLYTYTLGPWVIPIIVVYFAMGGGGGVILHGTLNHNLADVKTSLLQHILSVWNDTVYGQ